MTRPPLARGMTWSTCVASPLQYAQMYESRLSTRKR